MSDPQTPEAGAQPGPWFASTMTMDAELWASLNEGAELHIVQSNWDGFNGDVVACVWSDDDHDELATARLIAAAPDLLAALEACADSLEAELRARYPIEAEGHSPYPPMKRRYDRDMAEVLQARAAIAKARQP